MKLPRAALFTPIAGGCIRSRKRPSETRPSEMMGDGYFVYPTEERSTRPGRRSRLRLRHKARNRHEGRRRLNCLPHIGVDTVALGEQGFENLRRRRPRSKKGVRLVTFDDATSRNMRSPTPASSSSRGSEKEERESLKKTDGLRRSTRSAAAEDQIERFAERKWMSALSLAQSMHEKSIMTQKERVTGVLGCVSLSC